jgi:hypothetical protein
MTRFTSHAIYRFRIRRQQGSVCCSSALLQESFRTSQLISREEAAKRIGGPVYPGWGDYFFRADGTGPGVWVSCLRRGQELVITYLNPSTRRQKLSGKLGVKKIHLPRPSARRFFARN